MTQTKSKIIIFYKKTTEKKKFTRRIEKEGQKQVDHLCAPPWEVHWWWTSGLTHIQSFLEFFLSGFWGVPDFLIFFFLKSFFRKKKKREKKKISCFCCDALGGLHASIHSTIHLELFPDAGELRLRGFFSGPPKVAKIEVPRGAFSNAL